jgi:hypothetical protein
MRSECRQLSRPFVAGEIWQQPLVPDNNDAYNIDGHKGYLTPVLCHAQDLGLAGKTGSGTENRNGPRGASHFRYLTPFSSERRNPNF